MLLQQSLVVKAVTSLRSMISVCIDRGIQRLFRHLTTVPCARRHALPALPLLLAAYGATCSAADGALLRVLRGIDRLAADPGSPQSSGSPEITPRLSSGPLASAG